ncbi:FAA hydrolase family protein [Alicyclobacillaceae bacterium I2511]|nr:FAA hydrolase family protein [Alicyclobacillaceae bacterium I2511]
MRIVSFLKHGEERLGLDWNGFIVDANLACQALLTKAGEPDAPRLAAALLPSNAKAFLQGGNRCLMQAQQVLEFIQGEFAGAASAAGAAGAAGVSAAEKMSLAGDAAFMFAPASVRLLSPVPHPGKIVCVGRNYQDHVSELKHDVPTLPVLFAKLSNTIAAHGDVVPFPRVSEELDYEAELAVVIGKRGRYISEAEAMGHVAGYTAFNDITVRQWQYQTPQWLQGKSFDRSGPTGPVLVTADEISDPHNLGIRLWLNDELRQQDNTRHLLFKIPFLIAFISQVMTLEPGDIIATGTPSGVGAAMNPKGFMKAGDVVKVEIEQIGILENKIGAKI